MGEQVTVTVDAAGATLITCAAGSAADQKLAVPGTWASFAVTVHGPPPVIVRVVPVMEQAVPVAEYVTTGPVPVAVVVTSGPPALSVARLIVIGDPAHVGVGTLTHVSRGRTLKATQ